MHTLTPHELICDAQTVVPNLVCLALSFNGTIAVIVAAIAGVLYWLGRRS